MEPVNFPGTKVVKRSRYGIFRISKEVWKESEMEALKAIKEAGVEVITPNKELFREKVQPMYEEFSRDPEMKELIEAIQAI